MIGTWQPGAAHRRRAAARPPRTDLIPVRPTGTSLPGCTDNRRPPESPFHSFIRSAIASRFVESISSDRDSDYAKKRAWYALSGIPLYAIIDPNDGTWELHSDPHGGDYRVIAHGTFGEGIELPAPFLLTLDTSAFKVYPPKA
ncbi:Uma2 family endonuclease [Kitasatospora sp. LaBMicrA B282]|uniref:Uma2 family endonuclease n=1 Tax=Kitasatospora sp. LaBMicrA B282 TaxID=3420949 RepID=UPI003D0D66C0